jgi:ABC-2 type transport system ATP-binding protein
MVAPAIDVREIGKEFRLPHERHWSLKSTLINIRRTSYERQVALTGITFEVEKGEFFGIVGRNGSGKSTLLKLIAGIYVPTTGAIQVHGRLTPFIELGVGFNPELSGRDNVFMNGALLGLPRAEMATIYGDIVAFAELERFMDQKLKNYSSGMQVRLAFSIAVRARADIVLIDEVLAVGDENFQHKCFRHFEALRDAGTTVIFVTHDMAAVERFCTRAMVLNQGEIVTIGDSKSAAVEYRKLNAATN